MFVWNEEMVRFLRDASEYSDYHARLAEWMSPYLHRAGHLCDVGCGLGYLTLALSNYVNQITAVDQSEIALAVLREKAAEKPNITVLCDNVYHFTEHHKYDDMVFSFFGKMDEIAQIAKKNCRGTVFALKKNYVNHRFTEGDHPVGDDSFRNAVEWLNRRGVPFVSETLTLEMGQPLKSRDEARRFFALYNRGGEITDAFLDSRLIETGREDFPLYLPQKREVGCLRFEAADL